MVGGIFKLEKRKSQKIGFSHIFSLFFLLLQFVRQLGATLFGLYFTVTTLYLPPAWLLTTSLLENQKECVILKKSTINYQTVQCMYIGVRV
jgi:hypothetical protein